MIWLHSECLLVQTSNGETLPCSAEAVTVELVGDASSSIDPAILQNATQAVLHYFKVELGKETVTIGEFAQALARVLRNFGLAVQWEEETPAAPKIVEANLEEMAAETGRGFELAFFQRLREKVRDSLAVAPTVVRFHGLRGCVKQLSGARRWTPRCQVLHDQIVQYLRECWTNEPGQQKCSLVVR